MFALVEEDISYTESFVTSVRVTNKIKDKKEYNKLWDEFVASPKFKTLKDPTNHFYRKYEFKQVHFDTRYV
jgi:hypothetical protein